MTKVWDRRKQEVGARQEKGTVVPGSVSVVEMLLAARLAGHLLNPTGPAER